MNGWVSDVIAAKGLVSLNGRISAERGDTRVY